MTTPQTTPTPQAGPELDLEIVELLGCPSQLVELSEAGTAKGGTYYPAPISTDPGAAHRALEMWRKQKAGRRWDLYSPPMTGDEVFRIALWEPMGGGGLRRTVDLLIPTFPLAAALALRSALGGKV